MKDLARVLGVICAVAALVVVGLVVVGRDVGSADSLLIDRQPPASWDPILEPYVDFVEDARGLEFEHPVYVRFTNIGAELAEDFETARELDAALSKPPESLAFADPYSEAYRLLGLVELDVQSDAQVAEDEAIAANAGAFYDPANIEIVLPEGEDEVALRLTIVHELVHALQDQHGLIGGYSDTLDQSQARLALIEGDAERISQMWFATQSPSEQQAYFDAIGFDENAPFVEEGNTFLESTFFVSYSIGPPLVETIIATEGIEGLERIMRASNVGTTERFIDPLGASEVSLVDALSEMKLPPLVSEADGDLGALSWFAALAPGVGTEAAFDALVGYDDDAFAIYVDGRNNVCGRFSIFFDAAAEASEFVDIANELLDGQGSAVIDRQAVLDVCSPIGDPVNQAPSVVFPLVVANELTLHHITNGESEERARCAAIGQASTISATDPIAGFVGYDALIARADQFVRRCEAG